MPEDDHQGREPPVQQGASGRHRMVIVGGGAGGLELATRLGNTLGRKRLSAWPTSP
jgi:NADH dehydrogenase